MRQRSPAHAPILVAYRSLEQAVPFVTNKGVRIHWDEQGQGQPLVLVMGHLFSSKLWHALLPALTSRYRVIWLDNRGTGESDAPAAFTIEDMASDVFAVMDAAGVKKAHVFGVSMGGFITQEMALQHPERMGSMILGCTAILSEFAPEWTVARRILYNSPGGLVRGIQQLTRALKATGGYGSAVAADAALADMDVCIADKRDMTGIKAQAIAMIQYRKPRERIAAITLPALVIHGDEDGTVPYPLGQSLAKALPNSTFVTCKGVGHNFTIAGRELTIESVNAFIAKQPAIA